MIVQSSGHAHSSSDIQSKATKIVACVGTAYTKKGKIRAVMRVIKKVIAKVKDFVKRSTSILFVMRLNTRSGIPSNLAPPSKSLSALK